jgi:hypothetical protein
MDVEELMSRAQRAFAGVICFAIGGVIMYRGHLSPDASQSYDLIVPIMSVATAFVLGATGLAMLLKARAVEID